MYTVVSKPANHRRFIYSIDLQCGAAVHSWHMRFNVHERGSMQLFEMEMTLPSRMCLSITCRGFGVDNYAAGCVMFMHLHMSLQEHCLLRQIPLWRFYTHCNVRGVSKSNRCAGNRFYRRCYLLTVHQIFPVDEESERWHRSNKMTRGTWNKCDSSTTFYLYKI